MIFRPLVQQDGPPQATITGNVLYSYEARHSTIVKTGQKKRLGVVINCELK